MLFLLVKDVRAKSKVHRGGSWRQSLWSTVKILNPSKREVTLLTSHAATTAASGWFHESLCVVAQTKWLPSGWTHYTKRADIEGACNNISHFKNNEVEFVLCDFRKMEMTDSGPMGMCGEHTNRENSKTLWHKDSAK